MLVKNKIKANELTEQYSEIIRTQVRYYASKRAYVSTALFDEIYSETLMYVYSQIGGFDNERSAIQTYVARLAAQGVKRYYQTVMREANRKKYSFEFMASVEYFAGHDKALEEIENESVLDAFINYLRKNAYHNEIRYINATRVYGYLSKERASQLLKMSHSSVMRLVSSIRMQSYQWAKSQKMQLAWH